MFDMLFTTSDSEALNTQELEIVAGSMMEISDEALSKVTGGWDDDDDDDDCDDHHHRHHHHHHHHHHH